jgi:thiol-disulfide isomerase/thioredoxin
MSTIEQAYGIAGQKAPELENFRWIDAEGKDRAAVRLADDKGKFVVLFCFQSWCPGCHSMGLPSLKKMTEALKGNDKVKFYAIQTVFEGQGQNTFDKLRVTQKKYNLAIPFGHDEGTSGTHYIPGTMYHYRTGGTPWFIFIGQNGEVVFNDFHLNTEKAIEYLKTIR